MTGAPAARRRLTRGDWIVVIATVLAALVATVAGFHLLELWLPRYPAMLLSHGAGLALLVVAGRQWRARRAPPGSAASGSV